jgi:hypothetical protein
VSEIPDNAEIVKSIGCSYDQGYTVYRTPDGEFWLEDESGTCPGCGGIVVSGPFDSEEALCWAIDDEDNRLAVGQVLGVL